MATKRDTKGRSTAAAKSPVVNEGNGKPVLNVERFIETLVDNASYSLASRARLAQAMGDPRRDIDYECGYLKTESLDAAEYGKMYDREPVAARVVEVFPEESWLLSPEVYEDEDPEVETPFEVAWDALGKSLRGPGWYAEEEGSLVWDYLRRVDVASRIGRCGVLLFGFSDGQPLNQEVKPAEGLKLLYLRVYEERQLSIGEWEKDKKSPRYGLPTEYHLSTTSGDQSSTETVHWSRVLHVADSLLGSEVFARPCMQPVWNRLCDLRKTYGAAGQGYWDAGLPLRSIESHPQYGDVEWPKDLKQQMENVMTGLQRWLAMKAVTLKTHAPGVLAPGPFTDTAIEAICIGIDCPKRVFTGSERGELASSQDERKWRGKITGRQSRYLTPRMIVPFVDRLIQYRVLPEPVDGYRVFWPDAEKLTPEQQAKVAESRMKATAAYVQGGVNQMIPEIVFLTKELGYDDEEAQDALDQAAEAEPLIEEAPQGKIPVETPTEPAASRR